MSRLALKICDNCYNSRIIRHDSGMLILHCSVHNEGKGTCQSCKHWEEDIYDDEQGENSNIKAVPNYVVRV